MTTQEEREEADCNKLSCNYQFQAIDIEEHEGRTEIERSILYCTYCTHIMECMFKDKNAIQTAGT